VKTLVLDVGNTHTVAGVYDGLKPEAQARFRTDAQATADEYRMGLAQLFSEKLPFRLWEGVTRAIVSTVVPQLERVIAQAIPSSVHFVRAASPREFELDLPVPESLGADRLANVAGALTLTKGPMLIVDAGTATTFCLVDSRPAYVGGAIVPGLETSWKALQARAAKLYSVELNRPESTVGRTTETQIQSGVLQGYEALIEGMTDRLLRDAGAEFAGAQLFATGGCVQLLKLSSRFRVEPDLTLRGLLRYGELL
jgi:type III pantothenate kinase